MLFVTSFIFEIVQLCVGHDLIKATLLYFVLLQSIQNELPDIIYSFVRSCYSSESYLRFGQFNIHSKEGVQKGDPLGPLLFCIATLSIIKRLKSEFNRAFFKRF